MKLYPYESNIVIEPLVEKTRSSGLIIPDSARAKPVKGTVVFTSDTKRFPVGCVVLFSKYGGIDIKFDDRDLLIIKDRDILAAVDEDAI